MRSPRFTRLSELKAPPALAHRLGAERLMLACHDTPPFWLGRGMNTSPHGEASPEIRTPIDPLATTADPVRLPLNFPRFPTRVGSLRCRWHKAFPRFFPLSHHPPLCENRWITRGRWE